MATEQQHAVAISPPIMIAWQRLLRASCVAMRALDVELQAAHGMTLSDYDVLVQLRDAEDHLLKMGDLSRATLLTRSGMTRLVQGLVRDDLVEKLACETDARVSYARITPTGLERLAQARVTHHDGIRRVFASNFSEAEGEQLAELLGRIGAGEEDAGCCGG